MNQPIIQIDNLSKLYQLGEVSTGTLSHDLNRWWHRLRGLEDPYSKVGQVNDRTKKTQGNWVWALKDINLSVNPGEVLGIVGRNGAGKSTLLKLLSRVTAPTSGSIKVKGRMASLLEVGTGFHPELTGRENIYLNGAILGMRRNEITRKLDEIVEFSGCAGYLDTPVKRYSSGMYVRLAFSVAAHLDTDIMIVDEVLAVGDVQFQKKCLGKISNVATHGRTVLFVTHNLGFVSDICQRAVLLEAGQVSMVGNAAEVVNHYLTGGTRVAEVDVSTVRSAGDNDAAIKSLKLLGEDGSTRHTFQCHEPITVEMIYEVKKEGVHPQPSLHFITEHGAHAFASVENSGQPSKRGLNAARLTIPGDFLNGQGYTISAYLATHSPIQLHGSVTEALHLTVLDSPLAAARAGYVGAFPGCVRPCLPWQKQSLS